MDTWERLEKMAAELGADVLLAELARALNDDQLAEALDYVATCHDVEL